MRTDQYVIYAVIFEDFFMQILVRSAAYFSWK